ncbi:DNA sulfur modification protein DndD [Burkholderia ubonensis]|uniref:DNA sulfur modification protein DndD n=1 Tax=Burkholderia ubonensis TaxID=101571 RepID=UPI0007583CF3|nr:DNA sulfur modification protein DndD [Burkholderia ubonensis]KWC21931.1 DNA sulfur modification protein DndD [Burkholderia ubonensis]KWC25668.1 DNA sulfur modification protein DndD [Burkholderia ubonensis]
MAKVTFSSISIENLGPFRDRQTLELSVLASRPVILVKALNGSGKTTLLTALQIGLYGAGAISSGRRSEYEQLVQSLQRADAVGSAAVRIDLLIDIGGGRQKVTVCREWRQRDTFAERFSVLVDGTEDMEFTAGWDRFIGDILPAELVQLFLFDGEKIEALANPERLPDLLRRATEVFLGIGGIDVLGNDLKAVERRSALRGKDGSTQYESAKANLLELESQFESLEHAHADQLQEQAAARNTLDQARLTLERYVAEAKRNGLSAYEQAAKIRSNATNARMQAKAAQHTLVDAMSDPLLPIAWLGNLWTRYEQEWSSDEQSRHATLLNEEFRKRDRRILAALTSEVPAKSLDILKHLLKQDLARTKSGERRKTVLIADGNPADVVTHVESARTRVRTTIKELDATQRALDVAERALGEIPADEQLADVLVAMKAKSQAVANAEQRLESITATLADTQTSLTHVQTRLSALRLRMNTEFKDRALETKGLEAAARARQALAIFKERLLASKAQWLSDVITTEFRNLLRKRKLVSHVVVDPVTYQVTIEDGNGQELPMDRMSAGERQMLAISVLSALIKERKGRFPVVVDTPLARLDGQHRTSLIKRFFATVSHQVLVLSTDEEVEGAAYEALRPHMNREYILYFDDEMGCTNVLGTDTRSNSLEVA